MFELFEFYPDEIFKPLACTKHKRFYWRLITEIYQGFYSDEADPVDSMVDASEIRHAIENLLMDNGVEISESSDNEDIPLSLNNVKTNASLVFSNLKNCGWLKTDKNGVKVGVYMSPRVGNLIELLSQSRFEMSDQLGSHVFTLRSLLRDIHENKNNSAEDIMTASRSAVNQAKSVSQLMNTLSAEMLELYEKIGQTSELSAKAKLFFDEFIQTPSFQALHSINGNNHPYRFKPEILKVIDQLEFGDIKDTILEKLNGSNATEKKIGQYFSNLQTIRKVFSNVETLKNRVDRNHGKLVKRVNDSLQYQRRYSDGVGVFKAALKQLKANDLGLDFNSQLHYLQTGFYEENFNLPKRKKPPIQLTNGIKKSISKREQIRTKFQREYRKLYRMDGEKILAYLDELFQNFESSTLNSESIIVDDYYQYICFSTIRRLCNLTNKTSVRYKDVLKRYQFKIISDQPIEHDVCLCRSFKITKV